MGGGIERGWFGWGSRLEERAYWGGMRRGRGLLDRPRWM